MRNENDERSNILPTYEHPLISHLRAAGCWLAAGVKEKRDEIEKRIFQANSSEDDKSGKRKHSAYCVRFLTSTVRGILIICYIVPSHFWAQLQ
jgi:hypothetical protein